MNMVEQVTDYVKNYDEEVGKAIELELGRQRRNLFVKQGFFVSLWNKLMLSGTRFFS